VKLQTDRQTDKRQLKHNLLGGASYYQESVYCVASRQSYCESSPSSSNEGTCRKQRQWRT